MMGSLEGRRAKEGKAARLNTFSSEGRNWVTHCAKGLFLGARLPKSAIMLSSRVMVQMGMT